MFLTVIVLFFFVSCYSDGAPSNKEAVKILKDYYSFYENKGISAKIINRGEFAKDCNCIPIEFDISYSHNGNYKKTFYFYKNNAGSFEIKKFKHEIKHSS